MVILLIGPAGAGKTTLGERIARHEAWLHLSEDDVWGEIGHPAHQLRTDAGQRLVHGRVHERIEAARDARMNLLLEFLAYENPPTRILEYQEFLARRGIPFVTRVLRPSVDAILARQRHRGRKADRDVVGRRREAEHQLACLHAGVVDPDWVIDSSRETANETYQRHFSKLVETPHEATLSRC